MEPCRHGNISKLIWLESQAEGNADEVSARDLEQLLQPFGNGRVVLKKVIVANATGEAKAALALPLLR